MLLTVAGSFTCTVFLFAPIIPCILNLPSNQPIALLVPFTRGSCAPLFVVLSEKDAKYPKILLWLDECTFFKSTVPPSTYPLSENAILLDPSRCINPVPLVSPPAATVLLPFVIFNSLTWLVTLYATLFTPE